MSNSVNLALDVTKTGIQNPLIKVRQGDGGFETLRTTVTSNGEPMDLQGWTITFMGTTAGNHKIVDANVTLVEAPNGIFDYTPSKAWGMDIGDFKIAYFKFVKGDGSASSANFRVNVIEAVDLTQEEAQNYISVVDSTIAEINQHLTDSLANVTQSIADANSNANTVASNVTTLVNRVDDYNNKLAAIQVGGRNLFLGTKNFSGDGNWSNTGDLVENVYQGLDAVQTASAWGGPKYYNSALENQGIIQSVDDTFIMSAWVRNTGTNPISIGYYDGFTNNNGQWVANLPANSDWIRISSRPFQFSQTSNLNGTMRFEPTTDATGGYIQQVGLKLEKGNIATDWTPAPEDAPSNDAQLVHKTGTETIAGDKTFTGKVNFSGGTNIVSATTRGKILDGADLNNYAETYKYAINGANNVSNYPSGASHYATLEVERINGDTSIQKIIDADKRVFISSIWGVPIHRTPWIELANNDNVVHNTGAETIADNKTFTGQLNASALKVSGDDYANTASVDVNYLGSTISFVRIGKLVTFTSGVSAFNTNVSAGLTSNVIPNGFKPAVQQNVSPANQSSASNFFSFDQGGGIYSYGSYPSGAQPRLSWTYITTDAWPV